MDKENAAYSCDEILFSIKKKEILLYEITWMNLDDRMLSGVSQTQDKYCMVPLV